MRTGSRFIALLCSLLAACAAIGTSDLKHVYSVNELAQLGGTSEEFEMRAKGYLHIEDEARRLARLSALPGDQRAQHFINVSAQRGLMTDVLQGKCVLVEGSYVGYGEEFLPTGWLTSSIGHLRARDVWLCESCCAE